MNITSTYTIVSTSIGYKAADFEVDHHYSNGATVRLHAHICDGEVSLFNADNQPLIVFSDLRALCEQAYSAAVQAGAWWLKDASKWSYQDE